MIFIGRNQDLTIYGLFACQQWEGQESLPEDHPEVVAFKAPPSFDQQAAIAVSSFDRLQFDVLFNHENRIRALEGRLAVTVQQFKDALIDRWKVVNA